MLSTVSKCVNGLLAMLLCSALCLELTHHLFETGHGYSESHPTIQLLWQVLHSLTTEQLMAVIQFITSCPRPPILGFATLTPHIGIWNSTDTSRLPTASTCINQLKLPPYEDFETLRDRLLQAVTGAQGFGLS
eukprot:TRINITY_DN10165_c0_g1_i1.p4 TRINITY_DN10165_c0_g1~~TRINITY_DN10165_c0_g1_i1.p4  ORF type:complete len:133 (+),score=20.79 TRINITY_DN10165_c0_g1_i1:2461-2859(+)